MNASTPRPRINALCAPPTGTNPGMTTVDLALAELAASEGYDVTYWRLWDSSEWLSPVASRSSATADGDFFDEDSGLRYRKLRGRIEEFLDADAVVFWGDFLHMKPYIEINTDVLTRRTGLFDDIDEARDVVERHLLLKGQSDETLSRVVSYGTTLGFNAAFDYAADYGRLLGDFIGRAHRFWGRDSYSALIAQSLRPDRDEVTKGTDAALLLGRRDRRDREPTLGVFIGRSNLPAQKVGALGRALAERLRLTPRWLDWGRAPGFWPIRSSRRLALAWPGLELGSFAPSARERAGVYAGAVRSRAAEAPQEPVSHLLDELARHAVVLTDTYHVAVNAWRLGTPAICLTDAPSDGSWDVNSGGGSASRDKRAELYSQFDATPLLVDGRSFEGRLEPIVDRLTAFLGNEELLEVVHARVGALAEQGRAQVTTALRSFARV